MTIHGPKLRGFTAMAAAAALTAAGLIAAPAASAAPTTAAAEHALAIEGVIRVIPDETGSGVDEVAVVTESGAEIDITGVEVDGAVTGTAFEGTVALEGEVAAAAADADTAEAAEAAVAEAQTEPVEILEAEITPPTEAAVAAAAHTVDVMWLAPSGYARPALADVDAMVSRLDDFWRTQSDGQISGFTGTVKFGTVSAALACDAQTTWNYAAGSSGFNRGSASWYWSAPNRRHLVTVVPGGLCGLGSGLGTVGTPHQGGLAWASVADDVTWWDQVVFHEIGHNIGLGHSNMTVCALPTVEGPGCEDWEYYDGYDVMGGGQMYSGITNFHDIAALNASHKVNIDALTRTGGSPGIATVTATTAPQTFTLSATGLDAGLRALEVRTPTGGRTFVEYRSAVGRDAAAFYKRVSGRTNHYPEGVRFLRLDCATQGCWGVDSTALRNSRGRLAYGEGETYRSLAVGDDPGFRVFVVALTTNTATVQVVAEQLVDLTGVGTPTVAGEPRVGARLTAVPGTWQSGVSFTYQWQVDVRAACRGPREDGQRDRDGPGSRLRLAIGDLGAHRARGRRHARRTGPDDQRNREGRSRAHRAAGHLDGGYGPALSVVRRRGRGSRGDEGELRPDGRPRRQGGDGAGHRPPRRLHDGDDRLRRDEGGRQGDHEPRQAEDQRDEEGRQEAHREARRRRRTQLQVPVVRERQGDQGQDRQDLHAPPLRPRKEDHRQGDLHEAGLHERREEVRGHRAHQVDAGSDAVSPSRRSAAPSHGRAPRPAGSTAR